jgi:hypothetical protein
MALIKSITDQLRALSQRVTRLSCECSDHQLSRALEELAIDLVMRAAELDHRFDC